MRRNVILRRKEENPEVGPNIEKRCRFEKVLQFIFSHKKPQQNR